MGTKEPRRILAVDLRSLGAAAVVPVAVGTAERNVELPVRFAGEAHSDQVRWKEFCRRAADLAVAVEAPAAVAVVAGSFVVDTNPRAEVEAGAGTAVAHRLLPPQWTERCQ